MSQYEYNEQFEQTSDDFVAHWKMGREAARNATKSINEMVSILHEQYPDWPYTKIAYTIYNKHEHLEGFTRQTIRKALSDELVESLGLEDSSIKKSHNKVGKGLPTLLDNKDPEQSSSPDEELHDLPEPTDNEQVDDEEEEEQDIIYDKDLLNKHVKHIAKLEDKINQLQIERIPTRSDKFEFVYRIEFTDEMFQLIKANSSICPFNVTAFPSKGDGWLRFDRETIEREIKEAQKKK